jgi:hypothetical protein
MVVAKVCIAVFLCLSGLTSLLFSATLLVKTLSFVAGSEVVPGEIVEIRFVERRSQSWVPVFKYADLDGTQRTGKGVECSRDRWKTGQRVGVRYFKDSPEKASINSFREIWMVPLLVLGFALGFSAYALWFTRMTLKPERACQLKR